MTALPPEVPERLQDDTPEYVHAISAYNICLRAERSLQLAVDNGEDVGKDLIYIRVLGYLIRLLPTDLALRAIVKEIFDAKSGRAIFDVGNQGVCVPKFSSTYYLTRSPVRAYKGRIPTPSNHASPPSFDTVADMLNDTLEEAPQSQSTAKKHDRITLSALYRDKYRCVVTGKYDLSSVLTIKELRDKLNADRTLKTDATWCVHIFAESTNQNTELESHNRGCAANLWAVMFHFGYTQLPNDLNGSNVHRLENVMTVAPGFQIAFDQLHVWFIATNAQNKYKLQSAEPFILNNYPEYVTFTTLDPIKFPVPSPVYLSIHAACAQVAHLSGAGTCIQKFYRDMDDSKTLDPNGASVDMLEHALLELQIAGRPISA